MVLLLATTDAANFPIWMESHSGNASDQTAMPEAAVKIKRFCRELANAPDFIYVGDSAIYANILQHSADMFWISRAPKKIKLENLKTERVVFKSQTDPVIITAETLKNIPAQRKPSQASDTCTKIDKNKKPA